jgi:tripartite-type tricarboxylate transporter receptor subunit TctC
MLRSLIVLAAAIATTGAMAQSYPSRTVRMVVPNAPGGPTDIVGRVLAQRLSESVGQPVIVENRLGAGGTVGTEAVARSPADGYTLVFSASGAMVITPHLNSRLPYDPFRDFAPVALGATSPLVLFVNPTSTIRSLQELIAQAKAQPGRLNYSTAGIGTPPHLAAELLKASAGIDVVHIPYKGAPQAEAGVMAGEVAFMFSQPSMVNLARAGKVRTLAVSSAARSLLAPDLPTLAEAGLPGFEVIAWYGVLAPAKTPEEIVTRLNAEMMRALGQKEVADRLQSLGFEPPAPHSAAEFLAFMRKESTKWQKVIRDAGIVAE